MKEIIVSAIEANQRLDKFLLKYLNKCSKGYLYKCMRTNKIKLNGKKPKGSEVILEGDTIRVFLLDEKIQTLIEVKEAKLTPISFKVVYEDDNVLIIDKPLGLLTQKDKKDGHSLADEVRSYFLGKETDYDEILGFTPAPCNRLDRNTCGIVLVGKNLPATQALSELIKTKQISKYYMTIVMGQIKSPIILKGYHIKSEDKNQVQIFDKPVEGAKPVETRIVPIKTNGRHTLVEVQLITGKTHQIRAHLRQIGHPIIGDSKYGDSVENTYFKSCYGLHHQFLCAYKIKFEICKSPIEYLQDRVFTVTVPKIYSEICKDEGLIK
ncbi:MAG: RluA family pseudouridine synthase [Cellulosilyticaceae bacterium]